MEVIFRALPSTLIGIFLVGAENGFSQIVGKRTQLSKGSELSPTGRGKGPLMPNKNDDAVRALFLAGEFVENQYNSTIKRQDAELFLVLLANVLDTSVGRRLTILALAKALCARFCIVGNQLE